MCNNIYKIRIQKGITQKDLAKKIGCSQQFISNIENHKTIPSLKLAYKIKHALNVSMEEIFFMCHHEHEV